MIIDAAENFITHAVKRVCDVRSVLLILKYEREKFVMLEILNENVKFEIDKV